MVEYITTVIAPYMYEKRKHLEAYKTGLTTLCKRQPSSQTIPQSQV